METFRMIRNVKNMLSAYHMVSEGDHVICAVSGGRDSIALLHCMAVLSSDLQLTITAAHFNHCLRGAESDRDEAFVRSFCADLQIPLTCGRADVRAYAAAHHLGTEEAARTLRYRFLCAIDPDAKVATAHNADDNLETLLLHLIRGCGLHGLGGIPPVRGCLIRPLLTCDRSLINAYLEENRLSYVEDSTNHEDAYLRNRIRHHVVPVLREENPSVATAVSRMELKLRQEDAFLDSHAEAEFSKLSPRSGTLEIPGLLAAPEPLRLRILRKFLAEVPECAETHIVSALALCTSACPSGRLSLPGGFILRRHYSQLQLTAEGPSDVPAAQPLTIPGPIHWGPWELTATTGIFPCDHGPDALVLTYIPEADLTVRPRQAGDRLKLPGGTKKVSRYMIDRKIPQDLRDSYPVLCLDGTPAALLPLVVSLPYRPKAGERCLILTVRKREDTK